MVPNFSISWIDEIFLFRNTSTTRNTTWIIDGYVLIMINWNIISDFSGSTNESLIFNRYVEIMLKLIILNLLRRRLNNFFVLSKNGIRFIEINYQMFFINNRSINILFVINIARFLNYFFSKFLLHDWFSSHGTGIYYLILTLDHSYFNVFLLNNRLNDRLINKFVSSNRNLFDIH